ncbi:MAG: thiolase family protein [Balneolaceae bacterium]
MAKEIYIASACRTACGKAGKGSLRFTRPDTLGGEVIRDLLKRTPGLEPDMIEDVIMGCAFPEASQGMNVARQCAILGGLPDSVPGMTINRFCSSGLQAISIAAERILSGGADIIIAGGVESMSLVPMGGYVNHPNPELAENRPEVYLNMGLTAEKVAGKYDIHRKDQDLYALNSHRKAVGAWEKGCFDDQITPVGITSKYVTPEGQKEEYKYIFRKDEGPRKNTSLKALGELKAVFMQDGRVTAGNSSQMNDAASAVVVMSRDRAEELGVTPMARYLGFAVAGVPPDLMGIGPVEAVPKVLDYAGLKLDEIDLIELNEAFAAQTLAVIRELGMNEEKVNVNGGAIAMGHPLGCTGAKLTTQILYELERRNKRYGLVTMCVGGGMGAAGIFERVNSFNSVTS